MLSFGFVLSYLLRCRMHSDTVCMIEGIRVQRSNSLNPCCKFPIRLPGDIKLGKLQSSMTTVGETVAFACTALKGNDATFAWTKNGYVLRGNEGRYSILGNKLTSVLTIEDVGQDDSGNFTCVASNARSEDRTSATLVVQGNSERVLQTFVVRVTNSRTDPRTVSLTFSLFPPFYRSRLIKFILL